MSYQNAEGSGDYWVPVAINLDGFKKNKVVDYEGDTAVVESQVDLMQYTGLKDKNGVEIYEGDILQFHSYLKTVLFSDGVFGSIPADSFGSYSGFLPLKSFSSRAQVIGNIHENPELVQ